MVNIRKIVFLSALLMSVSSITAPTYAMDNGDEQGKPVRTFPVKPKAVGKLGNPEFDRWQGELMDAYKSLQTEFKGNPEGLSKAIIELYQKSGPLI